MIEQPDEIDRLPRAAAVLMARLLVPTGARPPTLAALRKDVAAVVGPLDDDGWAKAVSALTAAGLATAAGPGAKPARRAAVSKEVALHLTGDGRTAARDRLGSVADAAKLTAGKIAAFWKFADPRPSAATVLLTRLYVPADKPPTRKALRQSVSDVVGPLDDAGWAAAIASLTSAGYVVEAAPTAVAVAPSVAEVPSAGPIPLTDAGRAAAMAWLGMDPAPTALTWAAVRDKWLPAATVPPADRPAFADDKRVVPLLLGQLLDVGHVATVEEAVQAAVCKDVGHPEAKTLDELVSVVLGQRLGKTLPPLTAKQRATQVPAAAFTLPKADAKAVRAAAVKRWATGGPRADAPAASPPAPLDDLPAFAAAVNAAAAESTTGRFGPDKVFISHVHRQLVDGSQLDAFKRRLVEANTAGLVRLARADLVAAMDPADVRESETRYLTAEFHFVRVEPPRPQ